ncbi:spore cortex biosynthesis protein YabQ [Paenibacillus aquistagni]|uniref:Spore cortex biosynthesis protein YabQ n=1 Tax=Paenibacillus aquistagni TaxID=1852522 RepID=A0A1X7LZ70_9BACL|nr:spore cortex biosynthesis protein YabQ [Paenibacillus aquistagni]NMM55241.1 spore cortex biosynthesis protein YabQ [Paenibacillus aquistagni]SMG59010.1 spore cortex biosynthesis protein YabQ [Paenibacillus aquistagni]
MSHLSLYSQWMTLFFMTVSGATLGVVYDSYRVVAHQLRFPRWSLPLFDVVYWLAATWFVFQMLVKGNQGELRFYIFLGLAIGAYAYYLLLSKATVSIATWIVQAAKAVVTFLLRTLYVVIIVPIKTLGLFLLAIARFVLRIAIFLGKLVLKCTQPLWWLVRWLFAPLVVPLWNRWGMTERVVRWWTGLLRRIQAVSDGYKRVKNQWRVLLNKIWKWIRPTK